MAAERLRIIIGGLIGRTPVGGWHYLQYAAGLARLGHDVYYHEDTWTWPYHPINRTNTSDGSYSARYIANFFGRFAPQLRDRWHYFHLHNSSFGMRQAAFEEVARTADVFLNIGGACILPDSLSPHCVKVFLDTDPGYNQIMLTEQFKWSENVERWSASVAGHDQHFTYGQNIHSSECLIPKLGYAWKTTRPPVVLELWENAHSSRPSTTAPWTTIMTWNAFKGKLEFRGEEYESKGPEFEKILHLPRHCKSHFKIALGGKQAPFQRLAKHGWQVVDGPSATITPSKYQKFIAGSRGEISSAKHVYVAMRSGWFSERSTCYLASGRPVVVQDTGFSDTLRTGEGILAFRTMEEAVEAIHQVEGNYLRHAKAARACALEYFDSDRVLSELLEAVRASDV